MTIKRRKFLPFLQSSKHRILFMLINSYLIIGVSSLWITIFYLLGHLNNADRIIKYCIPGFVLGISSGIIYFIGYQSMISEQQDKNRPLKSNS
jgi:ABC-type glycerol-3-phosphate transport system permease component